MRTQTLNAQMADHGAAFGAQQAMASLALFRAGPLEVRRTRQGGSALVFVVVDSPRRELCGCGNEECRVDALFAIWQALLLESGDFSDEQTYLAYWAYRVALLLCLSETLPVIDLELEGVPHALA